MRALLLCLLLLAASPAGAKNKAVRGKVTPRESAAEKSSPEQEARAVADAALVVLKSQVGELRYPTQRVCAGCNQDEYDTTPWASAPASESYKFHFPGDGTAHFCAVAACGKRSVIIGIPKGVWVSEFEWVCPKYELKNGVYRETGRSPAWARLETGNKTFVTSCDRPGEQIEPNPKGRYQYLQYSTE